MTETLTEQIYYTLSNGVKIPAVGFGLHRMPEGEVTVNSVKCAIESGYRHIDTAWAYHNQIGVGKAIKECIEEGIVKREDLFITSKLYMHRMSYEETLDNFQESLEQLGLDYLDLYLIHDVDRTDADWKIKNIDSWRAMEKLYKEGKVRAIGVSNYGIEHLEFLLSKAEIKPMVNQVETHPQHQQIRLAGFCRGQNILIESWAPLFEGKILKNPVVQDIGQRLGKTPAQIAIRWNLRRIGRRFTARFYQFKRIETISGAFLTPRKIKRNNIDILQFRTFCQHFAKLRYRYFHGAPGIRF